MNKPLLILFMVFALTRINATDLPTLSILKDKTFVLNMNDWSTDELKISFFTPEGIEVYSESIQPTDEQQKEYNLQILRKGSYQVEITNGKKIITYDILLANSSIARISKNRESNNPQVINKNIISKIKFINQLNQENSFL